MLGWCVLSEREHWFGFGFLCGFVVEFVVLGEVSALCGCVVWFVVGCVSVVVADRDRVLVGVYVDVCWYECVVVFCDWEVVIDLVVLVLECVVGVYVVVLLECCCDCDLVGFVDGYWGCVFVVCFVVELVVCVCVEVFDCVVCVECVCVSVVGGDRDLVGGGPDMCW